MLFYIYKSWTINPEHIIYRSPFLTAPLLKNTESISGTEKLQVKDLLNIPKQSLFATRVESWTRSLIIRVQVL